MSAEGEMFSATREAMWAGHRVKRAAWPAGSYLALVDGAPQMHIKGVVTPHPLSQREFMATDWVVSGE